MSTAHGTGGQQSTKDIWKSVLAYAPSNLEYDRALSRHPGYQAAVALDGEILGAFSGGYARIDPEEAMTDGHLFRVASHSKTFTATAVMLLREEGRLSLEDTLGHWLAPLAGSPVQHVSVRELLSHSAGITRDGAEADFWSLGRAFPGAGELLECAAGGKVIERNEHFKYSNIGYGLLGLLVEAAGGLPFADFVDARILAPLQLRDTGVDLDERAGELAAGYGTLALAGDHGALAGRTRIEHVHTRSLGAATGFYSTASDMARFFSSHFVGSGTGVLGDDSKRLMQRKAEDSGAPGRGYGLGLIIQDVAGNRSFGHSGGYPGHITRTWAVPKTKVVLSVLTNAIDGPATEYGERLFALAALAGKPAPDSCAGVKEEVLLRFTGRFAALWGVVDIAELGGKLYWINPAAPVAVETTVPLEFVDEATLRSVDPNGFSGYGEKLVFEFDAAGAVAMRGPGGMLFERASDFHAPAVLRAPAG